MERHTGLAPVVSSLARMCRCCWANDARWLRAKVLPPIRLRLECCLPAEVRGMADWTFSRGSRHATRWRTMLSRSAWLYKQLSAQ